jgi:hypothetical protein
MAGECLTINVDLLVALSPPITFLKRIIGQLITVSRNGMCQCEYISPQRVIPSGRPSYALIPGAVPKKSPSGTSTVCSPSNSPRTTTPRSAVSRLTADKRTATRLIAAGPRNATCSTPPGSRIRLNPSVRPGYDCPAVSQSCLAASPPLPAILHGSGRSSRLAKPALRCRVNERIHLRMLERTVCASCLLGLPIG